MNVIQFDKAKNVRPAKSKQWKLRSICTTAMLCSQCGVRKEQEGNCPVCDNAAGALQNIRSRAFIANANYLRYTLDIGAAPAYAVAA